MYTPRHQKTYLSRAMTRAMAHDHPIGDPYGGPAYGERREPVSAILAIGSMFATGGAVLAGTATLMQGLAFAGAALSLVGNISGNSTLSKIGMVVGLAGGVGSLMEGAGMFGANAAEAATAAAGTPANPFDLGDELLTQTPTALPEAMSVQNAPTMIGPEAITTGSGPMGAPSLDLAGSQAGASLSNTPSASGLVPEFAGSPAASVADTGLINSATATPVAAPSVAAPTAPGVPDPTSASFTGNAIPNQSMPGQPGYGWQYFDQGTAISPSGQFFQNGAQVTGANGGAMGFSDYASNAMQGLKQAGSGLMDLAKTNPGAALILGQSVGSVADVLSGKTSAQIDAMEAQGELSKAQADKLRYDVQVAKQRRANLNNNYANVPNPLAAWKPDFQTVPPGQQPGLIGGAITPPRG